MNNKMHYRVCGTGKPIVLIHGWTMDSLVWSFFIEEFSADYTIIAVDLRGHGQSGSMPGPYNLKTFARGSGAPHGKPGAAGCHCGRLVHGRFSGAENV